MVWTCVRSVHIVALYRTVQDCWTLDLAGHRRNPSLQDLELHENHVQADGMVQNINDNHMQITLSILSVGGITVTTSMSHSIGIIEIYL